MAKKSKLVYLDWLSVVLMTVGGLNWGTIGLLNLNLVESLPVLGTYANWIYILVGAGTVWVLVRSLMKKFMK